MAVFRGAVVLGAIVRGLIAHGEIVLFPLSIAFMVYSIVVKFITIPW